MSLGDVYGRVNKSGNDLYSTQRGRIMREAEEHNKQLAAREIDNKNREMNNKRFEHEGIVRQISMLRREIMNAGLRKKDDAVFRREVMERERKIKMLEGDSRRIEGDIKRLETDVRMANRGYL